MMQPAATIFDKKVRASRDSAQNVPRYGIPGTYLAKANDVQELRIELNNLQMV
jgi:hypothetical protein